MRTLSWLRFACLLIVLTLLFPVGYGVARSGAPEVTKPLTPADPSTLFLPFAARNFAPSTFVHAGYSEPLTLDPAVNYQAAGGAILLNLYDTLIFPNKDNPNTFVPQLVTEVPTKANGGISGDGKTITFHIRPGVKFHDGSTLQASDVAYTFQRGLLLGGSSTPQWLFTEPLLGAGVYDIAELIDPALVDDPEGLKASDHAKLLAACQKVWSSVLADDNTRTVTFHLAQPWAPFFSIISQVFGSIYSKNWAIANGAWDWDCNTWQNYYVQYPDTIKLGEMGSGPYILDHWTPGEEIGLKANEQYWRQAPAWPGGPTGAPVLKTIKIITVADTTEAKTMLQMGKVDDISGYDSGLASLVGEACDVSTGTCEVQSAQPLRLFMNYLTTSRTDAFFNWNINTEGENVLIGSGKLDGYGIPPDFFSDIQIRKAFAYCFNYDKYLNDGFMGYALRSIDVMLPGMSGYNASDPYYTYDPAKCEAAFKASTYASLWNIGFTIKLAYNPGNIARQKIAEIYQQELSALNPKFTIIPTEMDFSSYLLYQRESKHPIFVNGWLEDYHDTHNWVSPYGIGNLAVRQRLPESLLLQFLDIIDRGATELDLPTRASIYGEFNQLYYQQAPAILLFIPYGTHVERRIVNGWYFNPAYYGNYYYALSKY